MFFQLEDISSKCNQVCNLITRMTERKQIPREIDAGVRFVGVFLFHAYRNSKKFDEDISFNIGVFQDRFRVDLDGFINSGGEFTDSFFIKCYRMTVELMLTSKEVIEGELLESFYNAKEYADTMEGTARQQIRYADNHMSIQVVRQYIHHPKMPELRNLASVIDEANSKLEAFETQLAGRESRVEALAEKLKGYESGFNFVGLYDGFRGLRSQKRLESLMSLIYLIFLGVFLLVVPVGKIIAELLDFSLLNSYGSILSALGIELLLMFLFKVGLQSYRSVKAQLLQIELRMALCQFVENYAEYAKDIKGKDKDLLARFERIVFSGIVSAESAIPSTFDGIDQVAAIIAAIKKG